MTETRLPIHTSMIRFKRCKLLRSCLSISVLILLSGVCSIVLADEITNRKLVEAIDSADISAVTGMLSEHASVDFVDDQGLTPLIHAVNLGRYDLVSILLQAGAKVDATSENGVTPLMVASNRGDSRLVGLLISSGANVNAEILWPHGFRYTPLFAAVWGNANAEVVRQLVLAGGTKNKQTLLSALELAREKGRKDVERELTGAAGKVEAFLLYLQWRSIVGVVAGAVVALAGLAIWPISLLLGMPKLAALRLAFLSQVVCQSTFVAAMVASRLHSGWSMTLATFSSLLFTYYPGLIGLIGCLFSTSIMVLRSGDGMKKGKR